MNYRSDWPEIGLSSTMSEGTQGQARNQPDWMDESRVDEVVLRWVASKDGFESKLYHFPIWNLRLELENFCGDILDARHSLRLRTAIAAAIERLVTAPPWGASYLFSRIVEAELLYRPLLECGFQAVEERRLYRTRVGDIVLTESSRPDGSIHFTSLDEIPPEQYRSCREQIFDVCADAFGDKGYSRHFTDPFCRSGWPAVLTLLPQWN